MHVAANKANLLRLKDELKVAEEGHALLDRKREALLRELIGLISDLKEIKEKVDKSLKIVYTLFREARKIIGEEKLEYILMQQPLEFEIIKRERSLMGVSITEFILPQQIKVSFPSLNDSCWQLDKMIEIWQEMLPLFIKYIEVKASITRIGMEILKTQKRIKILENVHIPNYQQNIKYISSILEENEREQIFKYKLIKKKL